MKTRAADASVREIILGNCLHSAESIFTIFLRQVPACLH